MEMSDTRLLVVAKCLRAFQGGLHACPLALEIVGVLIEYMTQAICLERFKGDVGFVNLKMFFRSRFGSIAVIGEGLQHHNFVDASINAQWSEAIDQRDHDSGEETGVWEHVVFDAVEKL